MKNKNLHRARKKKNDEFYTQLSDIEKEMVHYREHFRGKTVICNCDDPFLSNFFKYFFLSFEFLGLKKLISIHYISETLPAIWAEYNGDKNRNHTPNIEDIEVHSLEGDGDFRHPECIDILKQADIVVTNPPFSLFREYMDQLIEYDKKFLIIGNANAITYKNIFKLIKDGKMWLGATLPEKFEVPKVFQPFEPVNVTNEKIFVSCNTVWFTNLDYTQRHEELILFREYSPEAYPRYDNYDAINVDRIKNIPKDYYGVMGVPVAKLNPNQFEILGNSDRGGDDIPEIAAIRLTTKKMDSCLIDGKKVYTRLFIKRKVII